MTVAVKRFKTAKGAIGYLENLVHDTPDTFVFRGHENARYRLINSWQRHCDLHDRLSSDIDEALIAYRAGLEKLGIPTPEHSNRFEAMELGRHYGVPIPCLDFSYSPYVALFFAFNGMEVARRPRGAGVVFALNIDRLAQAWVRERLGSGGPEAERRQALANFLWPPPALFDEGLPSDALQFIPFPGRFNKRLQRQLGCLLYDTLRYRERGLLDLEDYLLALGEKLGGEDMQPPILIKVLIDQQAVGEVFSRLELMNITGANLYDSAEGVAMDIRNAYHYRPKFSYLRDIAMPERPRGPDNGGVR